jgi:hypothetical protein
MVIGIIVLRQLRVFDQFELLFFKYQRSRRRPNPQLTCGSVWARRMLRICTPAN